MLIAMKCAQVLIRQEDENAKGGNPKFKSDQSLQSFCLEAAGDYRATRCRVLMH